MILVVVALTGNSRLKAPLKPQHPRLALPLSPGFTIVVIKRFFQANFFLLIIVTSFCLDPLWQWRAKVCKHSNFRNLLFSHKLKSRAFTFQCRHAGSGQLAPK